MPSGLRLWHRTFASAAIRLLRNSHQPDSVRSIQPLGRTTATAAARPLLKHWGFIRLRKTTTIAGRRIRLVTTITPSRLVAMIIADTLKEHLQGNFAERRLPEVHDRPFRKALHRDIFLRSLRVQSRFHRKGRILQPVCDSESLRSLSANHSGLPMLTTFEPAAI